MSEPNTLEHNTQRLNRLWEKYDELVKCYVHQAKDDNASFRRIERAAMLARIEREGIVKTNDTHMKHIKELRIRTNILFFLFCLSFMVGVLTLGVHVDGQHTHELIMKSIEQSTHE